MRGGGYLFKPGGLGTVRFVAAAAERGDLDLGGLCLVRLFGVSRGRAVAGLASHAAMLAGSAGGEFIRVAIGADGLTGETEGLLASVVESAGPVVAELPEAGGNDGSSGDGEESQTDQEHHSRTDEVGCLFPTAPQLSLASRRNGAGAFVGRAERAVPLRPGQLRTR